MRRSAPSVSAGNGREWGCVARPVVIRPTVRSFKVRMVVHVALSRRVMWSSQ